MTLFGVLAVALAAAAGAVVDAGTRRAADRLRATVPVPHSPTPAPPSRLLRRVGPPATALLALLWAPVLGLHSVLLRAGAALLAGRLAAGWLTRLAARPSATDAGSASAPLALDLLGAALLSGAPPAMATRAVARALGGPLGGRLADVAAELAAGAPPQEAWGLLAGGPLAPLAGLLPRAEATGSAIAGELARRAARLRAERSAAAVAEARAAGIRAVVPVGLLILPAFLLIGLAPVLIAAVHSVRW